MGEKTVRVIVVALALLAAVPVAALADGYTIDVDGTLYTIDCKARKATKLGVVRGDDAASAITLTDLGTTPRNALYGVSGNALWAIDLEAPSRSQWVGEHGLRHPYGFCISPEGIAYANTAKGEFCRIDLETGHATIIGPMGGGFGASGDLIFIGGKLLSSVKDDNDVETLVTIDAKTGGAMRIGPIVDPLGNGIANVFGLIEDGGTLYGLTASGLVVTIDTETGNAGVADSMTIRFWGASNSIPDL